MTNRAPLQALVAEVRTQNATRQDAPAQRLMAEVRALPSSERAQVLGQLPFLDQAAIASLFAWNVLEAAQQKDQTPAERHAWKREAAGVARFVTCRPFSPLYLSHTQDVLDRFKDRLRHDPDVFEQAHDWQRMSTDEKNRTVLAHLATYVDTMNEVYGECMPLPQTTISDHAAGTGDSGCYHYDPATGSHNLSLFLTGAPYGMFSRLAGGCHELTHGMATHRGLQSQFDPAVMTQGDHDTLHLNARNAEYNLYLPRRIYGKAAYYRQPTEVEAYMPTDQVYDLAEHFYGRPGKQPAVQARNSVGVIILAKSEIHGIDNATGSSV